MGQSIQHAVAFLIGDVAIEFERLFFVVLARTRHRHAQSVTNPNGLGKAQVLFQINGAWRTRGLDAPDWYHPRQPQKPECLAVRACAPFPLFAPLEFHRMDSFQTTRRWGRLLLRLFRSCHCFGVHVVGV